MLNRKIKPGKQQQQPTKKPKNPQPPHSEQKTGIFSNPCCGRRKKQNKPNLHSEQKSLLVGDKTMAKQFILDARAVFENSC